MPEISAPTHIKRMRYILKDMVFKDSLFLYDDYFQISLSPEKTTWSGEHEKKLLFTFGLRYNQDRANAFFASDDPRKDEIIMRMSKQMSITPENIIKSYKTGTLRDLLISVVEKQISLLGIPVLLLRKEKSFEVYSFVKSNNIDEILEMTQAMIRALGTAIRHFTPFGKDLKTNLEFYKYILQQLKDEDGKSQIDRLLEAGFNE